jgi:hypothetical protein
VIEEAEERRERKEIFQTRGTHKLMTQIRQEQAAGCTWLVKAI